MFHVEPIMIDNHKVTAIEVKLPKTTLIIVTTEKGYIMCGAPGIFLFYPNLKTPLLNARNHMGQAFKVFSFLLDNSGFY